MKCKGCGKKISQNDYEKVADWIFCSDCFTVLMNPPEGKPESMEGNLNDRSNKEASEEKIKFNTCKICEVDIVKGEGKKLGIWTLCGSCYADMTFNNEKKTMPEGSDKTREEIQEEISEITAQERIDTNRTINCDGCGRTILAIAGKVDGDDSFCPDCFYKKAGELPGAVGSEIQSKFGSSGHCMCCDKKTEEFSIDTGETYNICKTCYSANPELAIEIAKERYQKYLNELREKL
ncbi:MAG: hypothetical protein GY710_04900 [Desulfobacteraceae bacterium]|nr:hypothetical protein [Desulfobacteraceae bacterium]